MRTTVALSLVSLLLGGACASLSGEPVTAVVPTAAVLDQPFTLRPGDSAVVEAQRVEVTFERVTADSRCPRDVQCIQAGEATVRVLVAAGGQRPVTVEVKTRPGSESTMVGGFVLTLSELQPVPRAAEPTQPSEYRATLVLSKAP